MILSLFCDGEKAAKKAAFFTSSFFRSDLDKSPFIILLLVLKTAR